MVVPLGPIEILIHVIKEKQMLAPHRRAHICSAMLTFHLVVACPGHAQPASNDSSSLSHRNASSKGASTNFVNPSGSIFEKVMNGGSHRNQNSNPSSNLNPNHYPNPNLNNTYNAPPPPFAPTIRSNPVSAQPMSSNPTYSAPISAQPMEGQARTSQAGKAPPTANNSVPSIPISTQNLSRKPFVAIEDHWGLTANFPLPKPAGGDEADQFAFPLAEITAARKNSTQGQLDEVAKYYGLDSSKKRGVNARGHGGVRGRT